MFSRTDGETDSETFYTSVLELLEDPLEQDEVKPLMLWWNQLVLSPHLSVPCNAELKQAYLPVILECPPPCANSQCFGKDKGEEAGAPGKAWPFRR